MPQISLTCDCLKSCLRSIPIHPTIEDAPLFINLNLLFKIVLVHLDFMADGASLPAPPPPLQLPAVPQDNESCSGMPACVLFAYCCCCRSRHPPPSLPPVACHHCLPLSLTPSLMPSDCFAAIAAVAAVAAICCPRPLPVAITRCHCCRCCCGLCCCHS
jgi:hypothetical protein